MNAVFEHLARTRNRCFVARSLFLWHQIVGESCDAVPLLRQLGGIIANLPLGADVMTHHLPINACPDGFDIQPRALPNADALFAYVPVQGLRLEMTAEMPPRLAALNRETLGQPSMRRIRVVDASGTPYRRQGAERFMLRYRLDQAVLKARDLLFLQISRNDAARLSPLPPLRAWIEIDRGSSRRLIETVETSAAILVPGEAIRLSTFPPGAMAQETDMDGIRAIHLYIELTGDVVDAQLIGETLLS